MEGDSGRGGEMEGVGESEIVGGGSGREGGMRWSEGDGSEGRRKRKKEREAREGEASLIYIYVHPEQ